MKLSVKNLKSFQPETLSKREDKKRVNIPWNHSLYFQIGLIVSLIAVFLIIESSIGYVAPSVAKNDRETLEEPYTMIDFVIDFPVKVEIPKHTEIKKPIFEVSRRISTIVEVVPNNLQTLETPIVGIDVPIIPDTSNPVKPIIPVDNRTKDMLSVEFVPMFPGCESLKTNKEKAACMSEKIGAFIKSKFRTDQFSGLTSGEMYRIYLQFKIDKLGDITDIAARAGNLQLEEEGIRVISKLPKMTPGKQGNTYVDVMYRVPIVFKVD